MKKKELSPGFNTKLIILTIINIFMLVFYLGFSQTALKGDFSSIAAEILARLLFFLLIYLIIADFIAASHYIKINQVKGVRKIKIYMIIFILILIVLSPKILSAKLPFIPIADLNSNTDSSLPLSQKEAIKLIKDCHVLFIERQSGITVLTVLGRTNSQVTTYGDFDVLRETVYNVRKKCEKVMVIDPTAGYKEIQP